MRFASPPDSGGFWPNACGTHASSNATRGSSDSEVRRRMATFECRKHGASAEYRFKQYPPNVVEKETQRAQQQAPRTEEFPTTPPLRLRFRESLQRNWTRPATR